MVNIALSVNGLKKSFQRTKVLKNVDFQVKRGEIFALLGSNGAGKTTTIKIICTLLKPDSGSVTVCGSDVLKEPEKVRENISLTGQFAAVDDVLSFPTNR